MANGICVKKLIGAVPSLFNASTRDGRCPVSGSSTRSSDCGWWLHFSVSSTIASVFIWFTFPWRGCFLWQEFSAPCHPRQYMRAVLIINSDREGRGGWRGKNGELINVTLSRNATVGAVTRRCVTECLSRCAARSVCHEVLWTERSVWRTCHSHDADESL